MKWRNIRAACILQPRSIYPTIHSIIGVETYGRAYRWYIADTSGKRHYQSLVTSLPECERKFDAFV